MNIEMKLTYNTNSHKETEFIVHQSLFLCFLMLHLQFKIAISVVLDHQEDVSENLIPQQAANYRMTLA